MATQVQFTDRVPSLSGGDKKSVQQGALVAPSLLIDEALKKSFAGTSEKKQSLAEAIAELAQMLNTVEQASIEADIARSDEQMKMGQHSIQVSEKETEKMIDEINKALKKAHKAAKWGKLAKVAGYVASAICIVCAPGFGTAAAIGIVTALSVANDETGFLDKALEGLSPEARIAVKMAVVITVSAAGGAAGAAEASSQATGAAAQEGAKEVSRLAMAAAVAAVMAAMTVPSVDIGSDCAIVDHNSHSSEKVKTKEELAETDPKRAMVAMGVQAAISVLLGLYGGANMVRTASLSTRMSSLLSMAQKLNALGSLFGASFGIASAEYSREQARYIANVAVPQKKASLAQYTAKRSDEGTSSTMEHYESIASLYSQLLDGLNEAALPAATTAELLAS
jgi:uncharacterized FlaG/YvyC family protein